MMQSSIQGTSVKCINCVGFELRKGEPGKYFCKLLDKFPKEGGTDDPSTRIIPFLPGKKFIGNFTQKTANKRQNGFNKYLKALITLPAKISQCDLVSNFLDSKESDLTALTKRKSLKEADTAVCPRISSITAPLLLEQYQVIEDYVKTQKGELSVQSGAIVSVIEKKSTGWWLVQTVDGDEQGWVPGTYLDPVYGESNSEDIYAVPGKPLTYLCTCNYTANKSDEVSMNRRDVVEVICKNLDGWWLVRCNGREGVAPAAYLSKADTLKVKRMLEINVSSSTKLSTPKSKRKELSNYAPPRRDIAKPKPPRPAAPPKLAAKAPVKLYKAIADYPATIDDGIDLMEGAIVECLSKDDSGWWFVETEGKSGWAPSTYMEIIPPITKPTLPSHSCNHTTKNNQPPMRPVLPTAAKDKPGSSSPKPKRPATPPSIKKTSVTKDHPAFQNTLQIKPAINNPVIPTKPMLKPVIKKKPVIMRNPQVNATNQSESEVPTSSVAALAARFS